MSNHLDDSIAIVGAGPAGLITAHVLLQDGFKNVQLFTRDEGPGGIWLRRGYEDTSQCCSYGGRLNGDVVVDYFEEFARDYVGPSRIRCEVDVLNIHRQRENDWVLTVQDVRTKKREDLKFNKVILCTGGANTPLIPNAISPQVAQKEGFSGLVIHSMEGKVIVIGGGKSAQEEVTMVFEKTDAFLATSKPLPVFLRRSRVFTLMSPHIELQTWLERLLHTTWFFWNMLVEDSYHAYSIPITSPLRRTGELFWTTRVNDEGVIKSDGFYASARDGKINLVAPNRVVGYTKDGLKAKIVILATGYDCSWGLVDAFTEETQDSVGIKRVPLECGPDEWKSYLSLAHPPNVSTVKIGQTQLEQSVPLFHRGLVPAKNILHHDFAVNGATVTTNNGFAFEVGAHWISSYFLGENMRLPKTSSEAISRAQREARWNSKRFPELYEGGNDSYGAGVQFWSWPQMADELLEDMHLLNLKLRHAGNWLTWPFSVVDPEQIKSLGEERRIKREKES
ncbi:hypothetical protein BDQ17DRAFT_1391078 [Cyathus striatus]|nr:hypothetical protein BDQ17DRAFT_1391078 [Cyathus striatus]